VKHDLSISITAHGPPAPRLSQTAPPSCAGFGGDDSFSFDEKTAPLILTCAMGEGL
jgi:hypothetical protein